MARVEKDIYNLEGEDLAEEGEKEEPVDEEFENHNMYHNFYGY